MELTSASEPKGDMVAVFALVDSALGEVTQMLAEILTGDNLLMAEVADHLLGASGKRVRPALVLLAGRLGSTEAEGLIRVATAVELIHMATLVHDDILDDAAVRRGLASTRHKFGDTVAVLAGDFLFARAFQLFSSVDNARVVMEAATVVGIMCAGEIGQHLDQGRVASEAQYLARIEAKTARFIESSCRLGAMMSGLNDRQEAQLAHFGHEIGMAFQLIDDILDWSFDGDRLGKAVGEDLDQGVFTLPIIHTLAQPDYGHQLQHYLNQDEGRELDPIRELVHASGAIDYSRALAESYVRSAQEALDDLPVGPARMALAELAEFIVVRDH